MGEYSTLSNITRFNRKKIIQNEVLECNDRIVNANTNARTQKATAVDACPGDRNSQYDNCDDAGYSGETPDNGTAAFAALTEDDYFGYSLCKSTSGFYLPGSTICGSGACYDKLWAAIPCDNDDNNYASFLGNPYGFSFNVESTYVCETGSVTFSAFDNDRVSDYQTVTLSKSYVVFESANCKNFNIITHSYHQKMTRTQECQSCQLTLNESHFIIKYSGTRILS